PPVFFPTSRTLQSRCDRATRRSSKIWTAGPTAASCSRRDCRTTRIDELPGVPGEHGARRLAVAARRILLTKAAASRSPLARLGVRLGFLFANRSEAPKL